MKNNNGFTLIEILIYVAILGAILATFVTYSMSITDMRSKNYVEQEVQANARVSMDIISKKIRSANGVNIGASTFNGDPGVLSLSMADASKNPTIINLDQDNGTLQIKEGSGSEVAIVSNEVQVTNLIFTNLTGSSTRENIGMELSIEYKHTGDKYYNYKNSLRSSASVRE